MANAIYDKWREAIIQGAANSDLDNTGSDGVWVALVDTGTYTFSQAHEFYSDLSGIVGTPVEIGATKSYVNGVFDGADATFSAVTGSTAEALVLYRKNTGADTTWRLICYIDTSVTGLPVTPNGGDITVSWNASGIFKI